MTGWRTAESPEASGGPYRLSPNIGRASIGECPLPPAGGACILVGSPLKWPTTVSAYGVRRLAVCLSQALQAFLPSSMSSPSFHGRVDEARLMAKAAGHYFPVRWRHDGRQ